MVQALHTVQQREKLGISQLVDGATWRRWRSLSGVDVLNVVRRQLGHSGVTHSQVALQVLGETRAVGSRRGHGPSRGVNVWSHTGITREEKKGMER